MTIKAPDGGAKAEQYSARSMIAIALVTGLYVAARLWRLTSYGIYGDETFSLWVARQDLWGAIVGASEDVVHPPLFYLLLKAWIATGGESIAWLKLFPVLTSIVSIIPFILLCRELRLDRAATSLALGLMAVNCYSVIYAQDLRMYSLVSLLAICSIWLFVRAFNSSGNRWATHLALFGTNLLLVYTHYYGWLVVGVELLCFLIWSRRNLLPFSISVAALMAGSIPWFYMAAQAAIAKGGLASNIGWNIRPGIRDVVWFYMNLAGPISYRWDVYGWLYPALLVVYPFLLIFLLYPAIKWCRQSFIALAGNSQQVKTFWLLFLFSSLPVAVSVFASHALEHSVWGIRYLIISAPTFFIFVSVSALRLARGWLKTLTITCLVLWSSLAGFTELNHRDRLVIEPLVRQMLEDEGSEEEREIIIYTDDGNVRNTVQYYIEAANQTRFQTVYVRDIAEMQGNRFWVASLKYRFDDTPTLQSSLKQMGFEVGDAYKTQTSGHKVLLFPVRR